MDSTFGLLSIFPVFLLIIYVGLIVIGIYCSILFIKLARRGIKALEIYIDEKTHRNL